MIFSWIVQEKFLLISIIVIDESVNSVYLTTFA